MKRRKETVILEDVLVQDYAAEGKSLSRVNGKVLFIENTVPGDVVDVRIIRSKKDWAEGFPLLFKKYSDERVAAFCSHFGICGGCQWQTLPYEKQLFYKQKQVADNLTRIGKIELPDLLPIIGCEKTVRYRNKLEYTFLSKKYFPFEEYIYNKNNILNSIGNRESIGAAGFHAKGVFDKVIDINICHLQEEPTNDIRKAISAFAKDNQLSFYDARLHEGWLRNLHVRISTTGEIMVNIVIGFEDEKNQQLLLNALLNHFPAITTLLFTINLKRNDSLNDLHPQTCFGKGFIIERLEQFQFKISPKSFFQTNTTQAEKLYNVVKKFAGLTSSQTVYDLYCGTGSIGIFLSVNAKKIIGVDMIEEAVIDAKENAALNNIKHAEFFLGDVIEVCNSLFFATHGKPDVIITDPPRTGMHEKLVIKLLEIAAPIIIYVSCNPATQARDLNLLNDKYVVEKIQPVDMFPHTHHIENVVKLILRT